MSQIDLPRVFLLSAALTSVPFPAEAGKNATFTAAAAVIPKESRAVKQCVQYRSSITATVKENGNAVPGVSLKLKSDRNGAQKPDTLIQPVATTDANGRAVGRIVTRLQGTAKISADTVGVATPVPLALDLAEAEWEAPFYMTAYILADESDFKGATVTNPCGLSGTYKTAFLFGEGVWMQGSGKTLSGKIITIDWSKTKRPLRHETTCFRVVKCPTTASGACAEADKTIAVDPKVVPMGSVVRIDRIGSRIAQDTGSAIDDYHIDVYRGVGKAAMKGWGNFDATVDYRRGGGLCD